MAKAHPHLANMNLDSETGEKQEVKQWNSLNVYRLQAVNVILGSWSLQMEGSSMCVLRSLLWLGLTFFHVPSTPQHGYIYMGDGLKNLDLPFML